MKNKNNLRFLLALGGTRIVVLKNENNFSFYANQEKNRFKDGANAERLIEAIATGNYFFSLLLAPGHAPGFFVPRHARI